MHILAIIAAIAGFLWYRSKRGWKLTVKACCFITALAEGATIQQANLQALTLHPSVAAHLKEPTLYIVETGYGSARALVADARSKGFCL